MDVSGAFGAANAAHDAAMSAWFVLHCWTWQLAALDMMLAVSFLMAGALHLYHPSDKVS